MPALLAAIPPPPFDGFSLGPIDVQMYGILIATGAYIALRMASRRYERFGGDPETAERVALWVLGAGFLGARIGYVIPRIDRFADDPLSILAIWEGGLALFGGLFLGTLVGAILIRRFGGDTPAFADAVAPAVPLAQAIGRWGNYFNQELYGRPSDLPWAVRIEGGDERYAGVDTFHPTFLYESIGNLILVAVLLLLERAGKLRRGSLLWVYAIGYGLLRAVVESLRVDTDYRLPIVGLSRNNAIAIGVVLVGTAGLVWWQRRAAQLEHREPVEVDDAATEPDESDRGDQQEPGSDGANTGPWDGEDRGGPR
ncbi:MAG: prolipoprotein diacylglyceryl transferase [Nitriliruptor sp.]|uniref:prolipoprotein diacylglyceryl transferase n=1 Tax=Nitriliruptor sp. TaxID=2448056 RepID=UPI0034A005D3